MHEMRLHVPFEYHPSQTRPQMSPSKENGGYKKERKKQENQEQLPGEVAHKEN
jgi:hypothetical protein